MISGRSGRIRTCDPCVPNAVLYRAEPHSDKNAAYSLGFRTPQEAESRTPIPVNLARSTPILPAGEAAVAAAARSLREGGLVAFPTETVYGLGADATNPKAIARLYQAKGRPAFNPLIATVRDLEAAKRIARFDTTAIRVPAHRVARDILRAFGGPVVAPSANLSGHVSPTTAAHVQSDLAGRIDLIVDGGPVAV